MASDKLNILLITSDQQHYDTLGVTNPRIRTPALDRLCREGTRFDRAYCPNPTCTPTRASIITGMYPSQHGAWALGTKLFEDVPTVGSIFGRAGYATILVGKAHFQPLASRPGMESIECLPIIRDLDFWRQFHGPWYGFDHIEITRNHADERHCGQHYGIWLEENGLPQWRQFFQRGAMERPGKDGIEYWTPESRAWALPERYHYSVWTAERTIASIEQAVSRSRPFFAWASFHDPHPPYLAPEPWASMYDPAAMKPGRVMPGEHGKNPPHFQLTQQIDPDFSGYFEDQHIHGFSSHLQAEGEMTRNMAVYYGMIGLMDREIGRILDALDRLGVADRTLVLFTSDHGHFLGQHGLGAKGPFHYEDLLRIPFVVRWPGRVPSGAVSEQIQSLVDLAPSFLAAAGLETPGTMTGLNQLPCWGQGQTVRDWAVCEHRHTYSKVHLRTYVNRRYKITVYRQGDDGELFDLETDPGERRNLWHEPTAAALKCRLLQELVRATLTSEPTRMPRIAGA